jgi:hypothetical protein
LNFFLPLSEKPSPEVNAENSPAAKMKIEIPRSRSFIANFFPEVKRFWSIIKMIVVSGNMGVQKTADDDEYIR